MTRQTDADGASAASSKALRAGTFDISRSTVALLVGVAAFALVFATVLGFLHGSFVIADSDGDQGAARFEFHETNGTEYEIDGQVQETRGIIVAYRGGHEHPQEAVTIEINGEQAFGVGPSSEIRTPWSASGGTIAEVSPEIVVYETRSTDGGTDGGRQYAAIEEGDVIEVVWYQPDGDRMNVLQRHVVDGTPDANETRERVDSARSKDH